MPKEAVYFTGKRKFIKEYHAGSLKAPHKLEVEMALIFPQSAFDDDTVVVSGAREGDTLFIFVNNNPKELEKKKPSEWYRTICEGIDIGSGLRGNRYAA